MFFYSYHEFHETLGGDDRGPGGDDALGGIASIDDQGGVPGDPIPVVGRMVGHDQDTIARPEVLLGQLVAGHLEVGVVAHRGEGRDVGVVVFDDRPLLQEEVHQLEAGRLARVVYVLLVCHAQQGDLAPLDRLAPVV